MSIQQHIDTFRADSRMQARSVIITVFGDAVLPRGSRVWLGSLIELLEPLDVNERLVRTTVFRLVKDGWLESEAVGRRADYMLSAGGQRRFESAAQQIYACRSPQWDRRWRILLSLGDFDYKEKEQLKRALSWQGFGVLSNDCFIHPGIELNNALNTLTAEGGAQFVERLMPLLAVDVPLDTGAHPRDIVQKGWDLAAMAEGYIAFSAAYRPLLDDLRYGGTAISGQQAFLMRTLLMHDYRKLLLRDPELPDELLPDNWPGHTARLIAAELYRMLLPLSETYLDHHLQCADGSRPQALPLLQERFAIADLLV